MKVGKDEEIGGKYEKDMKDIRCEKGSAGSGAGWSFDRGAGWEVDG